MSKVFVVKENETILKIFGSRVQAENFRNQKIDEIKKRFREDFLKEKKELKFLCKDKEKEFESKYREYDDIMVHKHMSINELCVFSRIVSDLFKIRDNLEFEKEYSNANFKQWLEGKSSRGGVSPMDEAIALINISEHDVS